MKEELIKRGMEKEEGKVFECFENESEEMRFLRFKGFNRSMI